MTISRKKIEINNQHMILSPTITVEESFDETGIKEEVDKALGL